MKADDEEEPKYIICMAVSEYTEDGTEPLPSVVVRCSKCSCEVFVTVAARPLVKSGEYRTICNACTAAADLSDATFRMHPIQLDEIARVPGLFNVAQQVIKRANREKDWGFWGRRD